MGAHHIRGLWAALLVLVISLGIPDPAAAYDNPDLLPDHPTPVIDLAKIFSDQQRASLEDSLNTVENETGWKLRVLTQYEQTPGLAVREFWGLDESSLLVVADPRGGNILNFNVGDAYFALMPRTYWVELQTRFGNQYYVKDHGEDGAVVDALNAVEICLDRGGCQVVPGLPMEQWLWTYHNFHEVMHYTACQGVTCPPSAPPAAPPPSPPPPPRVPCATKTVTMYNPTKEWSGFNVTLENEKLSTEAASTLVTQGVTLHDWSAEDLAAFRAAAQTAWSR